MPWFKCNSLSPPHWSSVDGVFVVVAVTNIGETGFTTYLYSNAKSKQIISQCSKVTGHHSIKLVSEFDVNVETGLVDFNCSMEVVNVEALFSFIDSHPQRPMAHNSLRLLAAAKKPKPPSSSEEEEYPSF